MAQPPSVIIPMPNVPPIGGLPVYQRTDRLYVRVDLSRPLGDAAVGEPRRTYEELVRDYEREQRRSPTPRRPTKTRAA